MGCPGGSPRFFSFFISLFALPDARTGLPFLGPGGAAGTQGRKILSGPPPPPPLPRMGAFGRPAGFGVLAPFPTLEFRPSRDGPLGRHGGSGPDPGAGAFLGFPWRLLPPGQGF